MKKLMLGAALAAAFAAPGLASADTRGAVDLTYENNDFDYGDFDGYTLGATLLHDLSGTMMLQAEGRTTLQTWDSDDYSHGFAAVHASNDMGGWDLGGYVGILNYYGDGAAMLGAEARTALGNFSLDGSLSYADFDGDYDGTAVRLGGGYFFMPNFAITAGASRTDLNTGGTDYEITELSVGGAYQFANNMAVSLGYTNTDGDRSTGTDYEGDTIKLGLRFNIGGGTLQENTNDGAWASAGHFADTWMRW